MISIAVHGGAWDIPAGEAAAHKKGVLKALQTGWEILSKGGKSADAVEQAIRIMEDDETFDAGRGSFLNLAGNVELDASMMEGKTLRAGAVAAVQNIRNPISASRKIMDEGDLVLLVGMGATRFAREHRVQTCEQDYLITARELERWREGLGDSSRRTSRGRQRTSLDTVGAVALDKAGNLVSGTSTGGTPNKFPGRIGDSPLIGCGTYADNAVGAVSATGWGESMIRIVMAKTVVDLNLLRSNLSCVDGRRSITMRRPEVQIGNSG